MALVLDTGILFAAYDRSDAWHRRAIRLLRAEAGGGLILPAAVIPEADHLLLGRLGALARRQFLSDIAQGTYYVAELSDSGYARIAELERRFADQELDFADLAVVVTAEEKRVPRIATSDRRDFEPLAAAFGLTLLP
jgi:predicted nucleic acid-binding protein